MQYCEEQAACVNTFQWGNINGAVKEMTVGGAAGFQSGCFGKETTGGDTCTVVYVRSWSRTPTKKKTELVIGPQTEFT